MRSSDSSGRDNPDALPGAAEPRVGRYAINGTMLYAEVRGSGPPVLILSAGVEDAEVFRPIAERLGGSTVVTYDRRGGRRSGREGWPTGGSAVHADDAAELLSALGLRDVLLFGASAGGVVATQLALRHPHLVRRALVYEPGYFGNVPGGREIEQRGSGALTAHLAANPGDWAGALVALGRAAAPTGEASPRGFFRAPPGKEWYAERLDSNAEVFVRDDIPLGQETVDEEALAASHVEFRFAYGTATPPIFREIATHLAAVRGINADAIEGAGHAAYFTPDAVAAYIRISAGR